MIILIIFSIGISVGCLLVWLLFHNDQFGGLEVMSAFQLICTILLIALSCCSLHLYQQNSNKDVALRSICFENLQPSSIDYKVENNDTIITAYHYDIDSIHIKIEK